MEIFSETTVTRSRAAKAAVQTDRQAKVLLAAAPCASKMYDDIKSDHANGRRLFSLRDLSLVREGER